MKTEKEIKQLLALKEKILYGHPDWQFLMREIITLRWVLDE